MTLQRTEGLVKKDFTFFSFVTPTSKVKRRVRNLNFQQALKHFIGYLDF